MSFLNRLRLLPFSIVMVLSVMFTLILDVTDVFKRSEYIVFQAISSPTKVVENSSTVLIQIDEESLALLGRWPWPRKRIARLHQKLAEYQVSGVAYDILFVENSQDFAGDIEFARSVSLGPPTVFAAYQNQIPYPMLLQATTALGQSEVPSQFEGDLLNIPSMNDEFWPPLSLSLQNSIDAVDVELLQKGQRWFPLPIDQFKVEAVSMADMARGAVKPEMLLDKLVVVGVTAVGVTRPFLIDAFYNTHVVNGSQYQVWLSNMIAQGDWVIPMNAIPSLVLNGLLALVFVWLFNRTRSTQKIIVTLLALSAVVGVNLLLIIAFNAWLGVMPLVALILGLTMIFYLSRIWLLNEHAVMDSLTGLANRRSFDRIFYEHWKRGIKDKTSVSVLMIDVDYFKQFNDLYGHLKGDDVLQVIGRILYDHSIAINLTAARYGGEEFSLVGFNLEADEAWRLARTICDDIFLKRISHSGSLTGYVTVSIGVCSVIPHVDYRSTELIECADKALYVAKEERNCVVKANFALNDLVTQ